MDKEALFTARWHLSKGYVIPEGAPRDAAMAAVTAALGTPPPLAGPSHPTLPETSHTTDPAPITISRSRWLVATGRLPVIGVPVTADEFPRYLAGLPPATSKEWTWQPQGVTIHHMAEPSLAQRPLGLLSEHMRNLRDYYASLGWSAAPHLMVDDDQIWLFSPLTSRGVHAVSFNATHIGLEMLGDYDSEDPWSGRGREVITTAARAVAALCHHFQRGKFAINFHRDDPKTAKTCPGKRLDASLFLSKVGECL